MKTIKPVKLQFLVEVVVECSNPEAFKSQAEFEKEDTKAMKPYLKEKIMEAMEGSWQYAARVRKYKVTAQK